MLTLTNGAAAALGAAFIFVAAGCSGGSATPSQATPAAASQGGIDRTVLPIAEPNHPRETQLDARNAKAPARFEVKPPQGAPNVIIFLIDDIGFGHPTTYGGGISMPTLDRLANSKQVGSGRVESTNANIFSADDAADVGIDEGTNVSSAYRQHDNRFTGRIEKVRVDVR